jgi:hypothetical protein
LPIYDSIGRLKSQQHWQTDVVAGWLLGSVTGYWSTTRQLPISVQILPRGLLIGFSKRLMFDHASCTPAKKLAVEAGREGPQVIPNIFTTSGVSTITCGATA